MYQHTQEFNEMQTNIKVNTFLELVNKRFKNLRL
jgi:hypothetical protein